MTRNELNHLLTILNAKHLELAQSARRRDDIAIERTADELDELRLAADRELSTRSLERHAELLRSVRVALDRIADGSYGACFECEEEISAKRLRAMPWATLCINCQERADGELRKVA
jgi:DnaK suppressor protein